MSILTTIYDCLDTRNDVDPAVPPALATGHLLVAVAGAIGGEIRDIPLSGTDGNVLTEDSTAPGGVSWQAGGGGGGGTTNHAALTNRLWTSSGHTGTASRIAAFDGAGAASYLVVGTDVQAHDDDLDALAAVTGTGLVARTDDSPETYATRTIVGTGNIAVTNGDGVAGNPTVDGSAFRVKPVLERFDALSTRTWQTWTRPLTHTMCRITVVGSGSGGAGGESDAEGTQRNGGGGGSAGGRVVYEGEIPADTLYVLVGRTRPGGAPGLAGSAGEITTVSTSTDAGSPYSVVDSGLSDNTGGTAAGAGGTAGATFSGATRFAGFGTWTAKPGQAGTSAGNGAAGSNLNPTTIERTAGCGGGGRSSANVSFNGGGITASGHMAAVAGGTLNNAGVGGAGANGTTTSNPFTSTGGGGGGAGSTTGGAGGNGALGSGGGGGGAGVTGGVGGSGGAGWAEIESW